MDRAKARGESGYTLIEAVLAVLVVSIAILAIAGGLLASVRIDNKTNAVQRANLALSTFTENLTFTQATCPAVSDPAPTSGTVLTSPDSHALRLLSATLDQPEVQEWVDRGMVFSIIDVDYADWRVTGRATESFTGDCSDTGPTAADPLRPAPYFPTIRVQVRACQQGPSGPERCGDDEPTVTAEVVERGGRN